MNMFKALLAPIASALVAVLFAVVAEAQGAPVATVPAVDPRANFHERGRFGLIGAITEEEWKGGAVFEHEYWEAQALAHAGFRSHDNREVHVITKLGGRYPLGTLNYVAMGAEYGSHPGAKDNGVNVARSYQIGPYLSLERYFAATPVMLVLWVNPVQYDHSYVAGEDGRRRTNTGIRIMQTGGFGLSYLFF